MTSCVVRSTTPIPSPRSGSENHMLPSGPRASLHGQLPASWKPGGIQTEVREVIPGARYPSMSGTGQPSLANQTLPSGAAASEETNCGMCGEIVLPSWLDVTMNWLTVIAWVVGSMTMNWSPQYAVETLA